MVLQCHPASRFSCCRHKRPHNTYLGLVVVAVGSGVSVGVAVCSGVAVGSGVGVGSGVLVITGAGGEGPKLERGLW